MRTGVAEILRLHRTAYALLLHVGDRASRDPSILSPDITVKLRSGRGAAAWLSANRKTLPVELLPELQDCDRFAELFASFFETSFRVESIEWEGELRSAQLRTRRKGAGTSERRIRTVVALALKHVLSSQGVNLDATEARRLAARRDLDLDGRIVAYLWELDRRAVGKSKGPVVHSLWRSLPANVRKSLDETTYWLALERIKSAARSNQA